MNTGGIFGPSLPTPESRDELVARLNEYRERSLRQVAAAGDVFRSATIMTQGAAACPDCRRLEGKRLPLAEVLRARPLPCRTCTTVLANGWRNVCRCTYLFHDEEA